MRPSREKLVVGLVVLLVLCSCGLWDQGSPEGARKTVGNFLSSIQAGDPTSGWHLLDTITRDAAYANDSSAFAARVKAANWDAEGWEVQEATTSDDGWYLVFVDAPIQRVPPFLLEDGLIQPHQTDSRTTGFTIIVKFQGTEGRIMPAP